MARLPAARSPLQWSFYHMSRWQFQIAVGENGKNIEGQLKGEQKEKWLALRKQLATFDAIKPAPLPWGSGITDIGREAPAHHLLKGGTYDAYGAEVQPGVLSVIDPRPSTITPCDKVETTGRRTALAYQLAYHRQPSASQLQSARAFIEQQTAFARERLNTKAPLALPVPAVTGDQAEAAALVDFCHALFNSNEFMYVN